MTHGVRFRPLAVGPHIRLARLAKERGWPVEDWG